MPSTVETRCCIVGGGPAGVMLGFLLARAGVDVCVLEKHADFLRDFRGDTIHPSTLELMYELGLLEDFLKQPHQELRHLAGQIGNETLTLADFTHLPTHCKFIALMPQWDFLNFLAARAKHYGGFHLLMQTEAVDLLRDNAKVVGVRANTSQGPLEIRAPLTVAADGRHSVLRQRAGLDILSLGAPIDVLWMRLSRRETDPAQTFGHIGAGKMMVMLDRGDYWQCAFVIPKDGFATLQRKGLPAFRDELAAFTPFLRDRVSELRQWEDVRLLTVMVDRLTRWFLPGFLCIGDAAHAMSPVGGVGINLAIQDAVAAANALALKLRDGIVSGADLASIQRRRTFPTRATQWLQVQVQNRIFRAVLSSTNQMRMPWSLKLVRRWAVLRRILPRVVGVGLRPEHVRTPAAPLPKT